MSKVTVYMPTYNYGRFLQKAILSVLEQKFQNWEFIVINDGSTDNTREILKKYQDHPKIRVIHQEKKGLTTSNNIALRLSRGDYIMRLDADDYLDENALLVLSNILDSHPEVGLVYPDYFRIDAAGNILDLERRKKIKEEVRLLDIPAHGACTMIRKSCLITLGGYDETLTCQDGYDLWIRFIQKYEPYNVNIPLFYYRQHGESMTKDKGRLLSVRQQLKRKFVKKTLSEQIPKVLAIIPVRKEPDNVVFRKLYKKPLLHYTLAETLKTDLISKIVVTSNDEDVLGSVASFPKVIQLKRPDALALPNTPIEPTVTFVLQTLKSQEQYEPDAVMLLYPHSPLRTYRHIEKAIDTMVIFNVQSVVSVNEDLGIYYQHSSEGLTPLVRNRRLRLEREVLYKENGAIYLSKVSVLRSGKFLSDRLGHIVMLPEESIKIDSGFHLWLVENILKDWNNRGVDGR